LQREFDDIRGTQARQNTNHITKSDRKYYWTILTFQQGTFHGFIDISSILYFLIVGYELTDQDLE